tara:strand:+ start:8635 stop:10896 length:2262 start_codon:yes stop_codon:yes gene_type:complete
MGYFIRNTAEFQNELGRHYKVIIFDNTLSGDSSDTFTLSKRGFDLTYETEDRTRFTGLIPSNVEFDIVTTSVADETLASDIKGAAFGRFLIRIDKSDDGGSTYARWWCGNILSDVSSNPDLSFQQHPSFTFTATDGLAELVDVRLDDNTTYASINTLTPFVDVIISSLKNDLDSSVFWNATGTGHRFLRTMVNWYTDNMPTPASNIDPLRQSGSIFRAFREVENGTEVTISSYDALDRICKAWGARLFLADGRWNFTQNNAYTQMASGGGQWRRDYYKQDNDVIASDSTDYRYSVSNVLTGGSFDALPPVQSVVVPYNFLFDLDFISIPYVLWNTWIKGEVPDFGSPSATQHKTIATALERDMGSISAATNARIEWNLKFRPKFFGNPSTSLVEQWSPHNSSYNYLACFVNAYLKLVGDSGKHYYLGMSGSASFLTYTQNNSIGNYEWIESGTTASPSVPNQMNYNLKRISLGSFGYYKVNSILPSGNNVTEISGTSVAGLGGSGGSALDAIPEDGTLFLVAYAQFKWMLAYNAPASTGIDVSGTMLPSGTSSAGTNTGIDGLAVALPVINDQTEFFRYVVDGSGTSINEFTSTQGTTVSNTILKTEEVFFGTGPTALSNTKVIVITNVSGGVLTPITFDDGTTATWQVYHQSTGDGVTGRLSKILGKEILAGRKTPCDIFNGTIRDKDYEYFNAPTNISGSKVFVPQQMTFNAEAGVWSGQWIEASVDITAQAYSTSQIPNTTPPTSSPSIY